MLRACGAVGLLAAAILSAAEPLLAIDTNDLFETRVRPVLARNCYACHTESKMGGLQLDSREHVLRGGKSGAAIVPGDPDHSLLIAAVRQTGSLKMPLGGAKLKPDEIETLAAWVKAGAPWPAAPAGTSAPVGYVIRPDQRAFWSFQPVSEPAVPHVKNAPWAKTPIDRFILAKLEERGIEPAPPAGKRVLLRRAYFDLIGLPPTPAEATAFLNDRSPNAFAKVVDRLLASPRYGERWGRYWLDVARYSDDRLDSERDNPYPNAFRYRDWVVQAFNQDMPYNQFVKAQIAGDRMGDDARFEAGLGFYALSPEMQDDRVDATARGFLGLTVACATCHNHKYDPIPTQDFYSLAGIFRNTELHETPLASAAEVQAWDARQKQIEEKRKGIHDLVDRESRREGVILAARSAEYALASADVLDGKDSFETALDRGLDPETLGRWTAILKESRRDFPFLDEWDQTRARKAPAGELAPVAARLQEKLISIDAEKTRVDEKNRATLGASPDREDLSQANLVSLERDKFAFWERFLGEGGALRYREDKIERFLSPAVAAQLDDMRVQLHALEKLQPAQYPFLQTIRDVAHPAVQHVALRGDLNNPGEVAPPHFLAILSDGPPRTLDPGKERLELAEAIASPTNPLTARVLVNRVWDHHFGQGIVRTPSNFGQMGDRPSEPELLDYLAARFVAEGWSIKKLQREIMLSAVYGLSAQTSPKSVEADPENRLFGRAGHRRLDAEGLRDELLFVGGNLDLTEGGAPRHFDSDNHRRTVYGFVSRRKLDAALGLFDFPNPNSTSERRMDTNVPLQRLYFMNSDFVMTEAKALAARIVQAGPSDNARIDAAYNLCFQRSPTREERALALEFVSATPASAQGHAWAEYAQVLLSSNEFAFLN